MRTRLVSTGLAALMSLACVLTTPEARAEDTYLPLYGYGSHSARVGVLVGQLSGELSPLGASSPYTQNTFAAWFNVLAFAEPSVFGTLLGFEFNGLLALRTVSLRDGAADPQGLVPSYAAMGRMDFEFAYDLLHWKLHALRQRVILELGAGFDVNSHPWPLLNGGSAWRAYPLVGGHFQTFVGRRFLIDLAYRYVPAQTQADVPSEHRLLASVGLSRFTLGAQFTTTQVRRVAGVKDQNQASLFALYSF